MIEKSKATGIDDQLVLQMASISLTDEGLHVEKMMALTLRYQPFVLHHPTQLRPSWHANFHRFL